MEDIDTNEVAAAARWRSWNRFDWNDHLLFHYFGPNSGDGQVTSIAVTPEELKRVTGDSAASGEDVRDRFVDVVSRATAQRGFIGHAKDAGKSVDGYPQCFVHLVLSCLPASEVLEDAENEGEVERNYREGLAQVLGVASVGALTDLPNLWEKFSEWLAVDGAARGFRPLALPERAHLAIIGYSVRLAFPNRRDLLQLTDILTARNLLADDLPHHPVISAVAPLVHRLSLRMQGEFGRFAELAKAAAPATRLYSAPFWSAVCAAVDNALGRGDMAAGSRGGAALLAENDNEQLQFFLLARSEAPQGPFGTVTLPDPIDDYHFLLTLDDPSDDAAVRQLFNGSLNLGLLSPSIAGGVLPFRRRYDRFYELALSGSINSVERILVRDDLSESLQRLLPAHSAQGSRPSSISGWVELVVKDLTALAAEVPECSGP